MPPIIDLHNVSKIYGDIHAVDDISLQAEPGEIVALLGASGCGKTTTLRLLAGLEHPDEGEICLNGQVVANGRTFVEPEARAIGMVFQDYALFPHLTIEANVAFALNRVARREREKRVQDLLRLVHLLDDDARLGKRFPHEISGGQQQRVALARALAPNPSVILLDEPFSNLDAALRKSTREDVRRIIKEAGTTALFVTHDQEEALSISDRVAVLRAGKLLQIGTPQEIYLRPASRVVAEFVGEANFLAGTGEGETVETALGNLPLAEPAQGNVQVMIRPERLEVKPDDAGMFRVQQVQFLGYDQLITFALPDGTLVRSRTRARIDIQKDTCISVQVLGRVRAYHLQ